VRFGSYIGVVLDTKEVRSTRLVDILFVSSVEVDCALVAFAVADVARQQTCTIVTTRFDVSCTERSSAVVVSVDDSLNGLEARFEVGAYGCYEDDKLVLLGRFNTHIGSRAEKEGANIERCATTIRGNETSIGTNNLLGHLYKQLDGGHRHHQILCRRLHTASILFDTEQTHLAVGSHKGFGSLKCGLSVVQSSRSHMYCYILVCAKTGLAPLAIFPSRADIVVGADISETELFPFDIFHIALC